MLPEEEKVLSLINMSGIKDKVIWNVICGLHDLDINNDESLLIAKKYVMFKHFRDHFTEIVKSIEGGLIKKCKDPGIQFTKLNNMLINTKNKKGVIMTIEGLKEKGYEELVAVTHWKSFHADDVVAGALLRYFLTKKLEIFKHVDFKRVDYNKFTGKELQEIYGNDDNYVMVYDVGRIYDPENGLFDHHQFTKEEDGRASAGMVFDWLVDEGVIDDTLKASMEPMIRMVDDNDIGVTPAKSGELPWIIRHMNADYYSNDSTHLNSYLSAVTTITRVIKSLDETNEKMKATIEAVKDAEVVLDDGSYHSLLFDKFPKGWHDLPYNGVIGKDVDIIVWHNENDDTWQAQTINEAPNDYSKRGRAISVDEDYIDDKANDIVFVHKGEFFMVAKTKEALMTYLDKYLKLDNADLISSICDKSYTVKGCEHLENYTRKQLEYIVSKISGHSNGLIKKLEFTNTNMIVREECVDSHYPILRFKY